MSDLIEIIDSCPKCGGAINITESTPRCNCDIDDDFLKEYWPEEDDSNKVFPKRDLERYMKTYRH